MTAKVLRSAVSFPAHLLLKMYGTLLMHVSQLSKGCHQLSSIAPMYRIERYIVCIAANLKVIQLQLEVLHRALSLAGLLLLLPQLPPQPHQPLLQLLHLSCHLYSHELIMCKLRPTDSHRLWKMARVDMTAVTSRVSRILRECKAGVRVG